MTADTPILTAQDKIKRPTVWPELFHNWRAAGALIFLAVVVFAVAFAGILAPYSATEGDLAHVLAWPSPQHLLGTDSLGRDVLSRIMFGGGESLIGVAQAVATMVVVGVPLGILAGYFGGWFDRVIGWFTDMALAIPAIMTLLVILAVFGRSHTAVMVALGLLGAPGLIRVVRATTLDVRNELYVAAAKLAGLRDIQVMVRHVLPRITGPLLVQVSLFAGTALLTETGLAYLGLGEQPPTPTWGGLVFEASQVIDRHPWMLIPTGATIALTVLAFALLGAAVRDASSARTRRGGGSRRAKPIRNAENTGEANDQLRTVDQHDDDGAILSLRHLTISVPADDGMTTVVDDVNMMIRPGETVGLVGESGCGKSITARSILGVLPAGARVGGEIRVDGADTNRFTPREIRDLRGATVAYISQEPIASLDPSFTVGQQLSELIRRHRNVSRREARRVSVELLSQVKLPNPEAVLRMHPHSLSGGMAQRVGIARALAGRPKLLVADEPTTALDVTVQSEILALFKSLQQSTGLAILLITHDWGVVAEMCERAYVMYAGQVVESASTIEMFDTPRHPYTAGLLASMPQESHRGRDLPSIPGVVPSPRDWPSGCHFAPRCPLATEECSLSRIPVVSLEGGRKTRCIHHQEVAKEMQNR